MKSLKIVTGLMILVMTLLTGCSDSKKKSSSSNDATFGEAALTTYKNTIVVKFDEPVLDVQDPDEIEYMYYFSTSNNITTSADAMANGFEMYNDNYSEDGQIFRGLNNSTRYYITVVIRNYVTEEILGIISTPSVVTGVGPVLTSLNVGNGIASAIGSGLSGDIWSSIEPTLTSVSFQDSCAFAYAGSQLNMTYFGLDGRTDTSWNPTTGDISGYDGYCIALCDGFDTSETSVCTNFVTATEIE